MSARFVLAYMSAAYANAPSTVTVVELSSKTAAVAVGKWLHSSRKHDLDAATWAVFNDAGELVADKYTAATEAMMSAASRGVHWPASGDGN